MYFHPVGLHDVGQVRCVLFPGGDMQFCYSRGVRRWEGVGAPKDSWNKPPRTISIQKIRGNPPPVLFSADTPMVESLEGATETLGR